MTTRTFRGTRLVRFGDFELDLRAAELRKHGVRIRLQEQPFRILTMLLERPGEVVLRDEIRKRLWPNDTVVEVGHGINAAVLRLREALGESAEKPRYIETVARRGYRFNGEIASVIKEETPRTRTPPAPSSGFDTGDLCGKTVSHFSVIEKLGGGGMGVVYRAQDLTLGRDVALKFLPQDMAGDAWALGRFQREARAASALNHPNVCTIYGVEDCGGQPAIVMEFIEGETLSARLARGPLPVEEVLRLATQVAAALDCAHRKAIVHRDLKPSNLLVTPSGVKVLDFGLAKMGRVGEAATGLTQHGAVMGTLHYMSPEQVQGRETDARSDIYSLGLVLYEMLTGRRAMGGDTAAVLALAERFAPSEVERIVRRCLAEDPDERWQTARDLKIALEWAASEPRPTPAAPIAPAVRMNWRWMAGALVVVLAGIMLASNRPRDNESAVLPATIKAEPAVRLATARGIPPPPSAMNTTRFSLSPDGRMLALVGGGKLSIGKPLPTADVRLLDGVSASGTPFWSPDGKWIAFANGKQLQRISVDGGVPKTICQINTQLAGTWGPDGTILIGMIGDGLYRVRADGGIPERLTEPNRARSETRHLVPEFLPGGHQFLFLVGLSAGEKSQLYTATLGKPGRTAVMPMASNVQFVPSPGDPRRGYLLFVRNAMLMAQRFDLDKMAAGGEPHMLAGGLATVPAAGATVDVADFSATPDMLVYRSPGNGLNMIGNWQAGLR